MHEPGHQKVKTVWALHRSFTRNTGSFANKTYSLSFALMAAHGDLRQEHCSIKIKLCADIRNKAAAFITLFVPNNCAYTIAIAIDEDCLKLKDSRLDL